MILFAFFIPSHSYAFELPHAVARTAAFAVRGSSLTNSIIEPYFTADQDWDNWSVGIDADRKIGGQSYRSFGFERRSDFPRFPCGHICTDDFREAATGIERLLTGEKRTEL
jgi:hypothetical protein